MAHIDLSNPLTKALFLKVANDLEELSRHLTLTTGKLYVINAGSGNDESNHITFLEVGEPDNLLLDVPVRCPKQAVKFGEVVGLN